MKTQISTFRLIAATLLCSAAVTLLFAASGVLTPEREGLEEEESRPDQPDEASRFRRLQLQDEHKKIPADGLQAAIRHMAVMKAAQAEQARAAGKPNGLEVAGIDPGAWIWLGPGNVGGRIRSIIIDPNNANNMWIGSVGGGIWRSTDAAVTWLPVTGFVANLAVSTIVINPANPNIMYAGTGEGFGNFDALQGGGVFQSTDAGVTWNFLASTNPATAPPPPGCGLGAAPCPASWFFVNQLAISADGNTILAAIRDNNTPPLGGIAQSTDGGATWIQRTNNPAMDVAFRPGDSTQALVGELGAARYSTTSGQIWTAATFSPAISNGGAAVTNGRVELAYASNGNPQIVYAAVNNNNGDLYRSTDGGQTYTRVNTGTNFLGAQGWYDNTVWVNPQDSTFVTVGGIDLWRSTDSGTTLAQISRWQCGPGQTTACAGTSAHADQHMIVAHPAFDNSSNKTVYFSNDGGLFRADDVSTVSQQSGWTNLNHNLGITQFFGAAVSAGGVIFGGAQDNGTIRVDPNFAFTPPSYDPQGWVTPTNAGGDGGYVAADPADANYLYGEKPNLQIFRSTDGGITVGSIFAGINDATCTPPPGGTCSPPANFVAPFMLDPNEPNRMLAGGISLWRSNDVKAATPTWLAIKPPVSDGLIPPSNVPISAVTISPNNPDFVVIGHNGGQIYLTFDGTGTNPPLTQQCAAGFSPCWNRIDTGTPARLVTRLVIDETRTPNWIYATFGGFSNNNVYVTKDLGVTWTDVSGATGSSTDLPSVPVLSLVLNPIHPEFLYAGTEVGIFASEDGGATWKLPTDGPANVAVDELFWNAGDLVAATHGRGLYKTFTSVYSLPVCLGQSPPCQCAGNWDCPCHWNNHHIPTGNDEVVVQCPTTVSASAQAKSVRVNARLILNADLNVAEDVDNYGNISSTMGLGNIFCGGNMSNHRPSHTFTEAGIISITGGVLAGGDMTNGGIVATGTFQCNSLTLANMDSTLSTNVLSVKGNLTNFGRIDATGFQFLFGATGAHTVSGSGLWNFPTFGIPAGHTVTLGSDVTFNMANVGNSGTFDIANRTLNFTGGVFSGNGTFAGTGLIKMAPSSGSAVFAYSGQNFTPAVTIASGTVNDQSTGTISGPLTIDAGTTFSLNFSTLAVKNDVHLNGAITKTAGSSSTQFNFNGTTFENNGSVTGVDFFTFNTSGAPLAQNLTGTGIWAPLNVFVGGGTASPSTLKLFNDVTFGVNQFQTLAGDLNVDNHTLTLTGATFIVGATVSGTGTVKMQPASGFSTIRSFQTSASRFFPELKIVSGTVTANTTTANLTLNGPLTVDAGSTFSLNGFGAGVAGNVLINGTLNATGGPPLLSFQGNQFTNNGAISGVYVNLGPLLPLAQDLGGTGSWTGAPRLYISNLSTTTLLNDVTFDGAQLYLDGRVNTGAFTLSLPCTTSWQGAGDVVGNLRRTNLAACPGTPIAFGNPFTTIAFTSGTPPTEVTVSVALGPPAGFANAVQRTYQITPTGGSGYTATLRMHYLDSELNGNNEATLQMYRNDGTTWNAQGATNRNTTNNWVEYAGVTQFSPWTLSSLTPPPPSTPTPTPTPSATPSPTATPTVSISGHISYCSNPVPGPVPNVTLTLTGDASTSTLSDSSGNYQFSTLAAGGSYVVTPTKTALTPASAGINTIDAIAVQRHFLVLGTPLSGCKLSAANVNGDATVNTVDAIAIQRFFLGYQTSTANVGKYQFSPASHAYPGVVGNQTGQDYDALVFGDVASSFVE